MQYRYFVYTKTKENSGLNIYFAPYLSYRYTEEIEPYSIPGLFDYYGPTKYYFNSFAGGVLFGYSFTIAKKINLDFNLGGGIRRSLGAHLKDNVNFYNQSIFDPGYNGITPRAGIDVGFKF